MQSAITLTFILYTSSKKWEEVFSHVREEEDTLGCEISALRLTFYTKPLLNSPLAGKK